MKIWLYSIFLSGCLFFHPCTIRGQIDRSRINPRILNHTWEAQWITHPTASRVVFGVYLFRKSFELTEKPAEFIVHVSADNRYDLYVNGKLACLGPAWSDLLHWRFESIDIAGYLRKGQNTVAARVVNFGAGRAISQFSYETGFLLQGNGKAENVLNTHPDNWKVTRDEACRPIHIDWRVFPYYYATFSCDSFLAARHPHQWKTTGFDDSGWLRPAPIGYNRKGTPRGCGHGFKDQSAWLLAPRDFPLQESVLQRFDHVERTRNIRVDESFPAGEKELVIPPYSEVSILLDQGVHTRAYPELRFSGGRGSTIRIEYAEALVDENRQKGNRNETEGKHTLGCYDVVLPCGGEIRTFRPLWVRVFRFVELQIKTTDRPLVLHDLYSYYTAYPYRLKAGFSSGRPGHEKLFEVSWRTLRNATAEVFEDGPYYEQMMYAGDSRIASLLSLYLSGDSRMTRNAIRLFDYSRMPEGLTYSRYPSRQVQINPQYSLSWIQMIYDYFLYGDDPGFAGNFLDGMESVLRWHENLIDSTGMLGEVPFLKHIENRSRTPKHPERGHNAQQTLYFALTLKYAAEMFEYSGRIEQARHYGNLSEQLKASAHDLCYDPDRMMYADSPLKQVYTQHANVLAILNGMVPPVQEGELMKKILRDDRLVQSLLFFKFYVFRAMEKAGMGDQIIDRLGPWETLLEHGLTTFPEFGIESRSDCHPWSAHPAIFLLSVIAGIQSAAPGFRQVRIEPHADKLRNLHAFMPHPLGRIEVGISKDEGKTRVRLSIPEGLPGTFIWDGRSYPLKAGDQDFVF